jgi:CubicO group peptidase (beta-lactamase class C family)
MIPNFSLRLRTLLACALLVFVLQGGAFAQQQAAKNKSAKIEEVMNLANKYRLFNGSVLVAENGKVIYKKGVGLANMEWNIPNSPETKFSWVQSPSNSPPL